MHKEIWDLGDIIHGVGLGIADELPPKASQLRSSKLVVEKDFLRTSRDSDVVSNRGCVLPLEDGLGSF